MLSFQIEEKIKDIIKAFDKAEYLTTFLESLDVTFQEIEDYIEVISQGGNEATHVHNRLKSTLAGIKQNLVEVKPRKFFLTIEKLQSDIMKVKEYGFYETQLLDEIYDSLEDFSLIYETYLENYTPEDAGKMVLKAHSLVALFDGVKKGLSFYLGNIEKIVSTKNDIRELSIVLSSSMNLAEFILKLKAIEGIYEELCMLLSISTAEYPIEILKIESGSLWVKVLGNNKVIGLLTKFIESGTYYIYRNYTKEGKLISLPKKVESIESILNLRSNLEKQGIDASEMNEHIQKASVTIAKELNILISGEPEVTINSTTLSIGNEVQKQLIENSSPLKLELDKKNSNK